MSTFPSTEAARDYFVGDRFAMTNGMRLDHLTEDEAVCSMVLGENHQNANGGVMGGVIFTLADFAFAALANQLHRPTVAQQVSINFLGSPRGTQLIARATCRKSGKSSSVIQVDVCDETGRDVALYVGTGFKL